MRTDGIESQRAERVNNSWVILFLRRHGWSVAVCVIERWYLPGDGVAAYLVGYILFANVA